MRTWQSMQPSKASLFLQPMTERQRVSALTSQNELDHVNNVESQLKSSSALAKQEKRRDLIAAAALAFAGASAKERTAAAAEIKKNPKVVAEIAEANGEPFLVNFGWAATCAMFSMSIGLVIWG